MTAIPASVPSPAAQPIFIRDAGMLAELVEQWCQLPAVAIDTEFERRRTFYPTPALVQVSDGRHCYLADPLLFGDFNSLCRLLEAPGTLKVLHSCREDLQVLQRLTGIMPAPLFDTQVAAAFLDEALQVGYCRLVGQRLGITLPVDETCSDWTRRPLSPAQVHYATEDVRWLLPLYRQLEQDLRAQQRLNWVLEDCARIPGLLHPKKTLRAILQRLSGCCTSRQALQRLQFLCAWRETRARQENIPRNWLLKEELLLHLANRPPSCLAEMAALPDMAPRLLRHWGDELLALARQQVPLPETSKEVSATAARSVLEQHIRRGVAEHARALSLPSSMLLSRQECRQAAGALLRGGTLPERLQGGWRHSLLGHLLKAP